MYSRIKNLILNAVPKPVVFRHEYGLRYFYYLFYKGNKFACPICDKHLSAFVPLNNDQLCPRCGSLQRTRRLFQLLKEQFLFSEAQILHFSPSRSIYRVLKEYPQYLSSDISGDFLAEVAFDITAIAAPDHNYDLIICYHILEHIKDDARAIEELFRVLKKGGNCIIQTPFKQGAIFEDQNLKSLQERKRFFGQEDHVRVYSVNGLKNRLERAGFQVEVKTFKSDPENFYGFSPAETVLICTKKIIAP